MKSIDIKKMSADELTQLLKDLRLYRTLEKELWERGKELYDRIQNGKNSFQVEYFSSVSPDLAWISAEKIYKTVFKKNPEKSEVQFLKNENLKWGIKVYLDDQVVDLSFDKIEKSLKGNA